MTEEDRCPREDRVRIALAGCDAAFRIPVIRSETVEGITSRWSRAIAIALGIIAVALGLFLVGTLVAVGIALISLGGGLVLWGPGDGATRRISEGLILVAATIAMFPVIAFIYGVRAPYAVGPDPALVLTLAVAVVAVA